MFVGGITYGELGAIRYLNSKSKNNKFIVITTSMINHKKIFNSLKRGKYKYFPEESININGDSTDNKTAFKNVLSFGQVNDQIK